MCISFASRLVCIFMTEIDKQLENATTRTGLHKRYVNDLLVLSHNKVDRVMVFEGMNQLR